MKTIGILGGMSWEATLLYYKGLNEGVRERLGGLHSARLVMHSVNFQPIEAAMCAGDWDTITNHLIAGARSVQAGGADFLLIATNTMHKLADQIQRAIDIPILHIADATAAHAKKRDIHTVGLLGTAFTMEHDFYKGRLESHHELAVCVPNAADRAAVHNVIFEELCCGLVKEHSRSEFLRIMDLQVADGAQAIILGCTELCMLVDSSCTDVPLLDTTRLHVEAALELALQ